MLPLDRGKIVDNTDANHNANHNTNHDANYNTNHDANYNSNDNPIGNILGLLNKVITYLDPKYSPPVTGYCHTTNTMLRLLRLLRLLRNDLFPTARRILFPAGILPHPDQVDPRARPLNRTGG